MSRAHASRKQIQERTGTDTRQLTAADRTEILSCRPSSVLQPEMHDAFRQILGLSPQEFRLALCIMDGLTKKGMANCIGRSEHTVDSHLRRIYAKLGVSDRASVVARIFVANAMLGTEDGSG